MITVIQLVGGIGTRLNDLTKGKIPKPLINICGDSILEIQVKHLISYGCKDFIWICYHFSEYFESEKTELLEKYKGQIDSIEIYLEPLPLSTFGSLHNAIKERSENEYLVLYGDIILNFDLYRFYFDFERFPDSDTHIFTRFSNHPEDSDKILINEKGYVQRFFSKKESPNPIHPSTTTSGIYLAKKSFFKKLSQWSSQKCDLYSEVLPQDGYLVVATAYQSAEFILDVGTPDRLKEAEKVLDNSSFSEKSYLHQKKALLLDRDGVLIKENGYITEVDQIIFNEKLLEVIKILRQKGILIGVITNQPHVAQGRLNDYKHNLIKNFIIKYLAKNSSIDFYYECKHHPEFGFNDEVPFYKRSCFCRKPRTGLLQKAIHQHNLDINNSIFIGNNKNDLIAGELSGIKSYFYEFGDLNQKINKFYENKIKGLDEILKIFNIR